MNSSPSDNVQWREAVEGALHDLVALLPKAQLTPALRRWQEPGAKNAAAALSPERPCPQCAGYMQQLHDAHAKVRDYSALQTELTDLRKKHEQLRQALAGEQDTSTRLQHDLRACERELKAKQDEATRLQDDLRRAQAAACADDVPAHWERRLKTLPAPVRDLVGRFFALEPMHCFLVQCGQFAQIRQLWEAAAAHVAAHGAVEDLSTFMVDLAGLYNEATPHAPLRLLQPQVGARYNYDEHTRIGPDGSTVRALLLPGLVNPGGKTVQNALVALG